MSLPVFRSDGPLGGVAAGDTVTLTGPEARHATTVRRLRSGEALDLVDGQGHRVTGLLRETGKDFLALEATDVSRTPERAPRLALVQALAKGDRDLQAVEACTELGVDAVTPWQAERSVARFRPDRAEKQLEKWRNTVVAAAKQSRRSLWPVLRDPVDSASLAALIGEETGTLWLVLHESASASLPAVLDELGETALGASSIAVIVGPEGGISDREAEMFRAAGARVVGLGPEVLRSSTAGAAAAAVLSVATGRWA
ncbi:16S rRNA (uracil(1498)-N(3))-methyltransferase [Kocuria coralli]|uniref:Ribosomal RNA small subunit methyltransferase E n=1 Tax=Kocuria coralli TaxID=1461025 RepID=A0A5J5KZD1_9MICC|nr:16S rRNA (uracil(1498)-N(3))-methyltransferase [Kocuria coralli]KAA9395034.1 16S rRNA (uracil(1498)-N(3))-methyltransferase [Kocuria coralli]